MNDSRHRASRFSIETFKLKQCERTNQNVLVRSFPQNKPKSLLKFSKCALVKSIWCALWTQFCCYELRISKLAKHLRWLCFSAKRWTRNVIVSFTRRGNLTLQATTVLHDRFHCRSVILFDRHLFETNISLDCQGKRVECSLIIVCKRANLQWEKHRRNLVCETSSCKSDKQFYFRYYRENENGLLYDLKGNGCFQCFVICWKHHQNEETVHSKDSFSDDTPSLTFPQVFHAAIHKSRVVLPSLECSYSLLSGWRSSKF